MSILAAKAQVSGHATLDVGVHWFTVDLLVTNVLFWIMMQACYALLQEEAASVSQQREQLVLAEKLFGMDITGYPDLVQVCCKNQLVACVSSCLLLTQYTALYSECHLSTCSTCSASYT